jgi:hypothetical protein
MKNVLKKISIPVIVAILTAALVTFFPVSPNSNPGDIHSFRTIFSQIAIISYVVYLLLLGIFTFFISSTKLSSSYKYLTHLAALLIAAALGYYLFAGFFFSIANYGIGSGIL